MDSNALTQFIILTICLSIGLATSMSFAYRANVAANWDAKRCDPGVLPIAGFFKPSTDPRTATEFAKDNWIFCQKEYVQNAVRLAAQVPKDLAAAETATAGVMSEATATLADVFTDVWTFCYQAYKAFMDRMAGVAQLAHNFMIQLHSIVYRLQAAAISIAMGLISTIIAFINAIKVTLIVAIIIVGIILALMIILFFILAPVSSMFAIVASIIGATVVAVVSTIAATKVAELYTPGACFITGTPVSIVGGMTVPIESVKVGDTLGDGGRVTAVHHFWSADTVYAINGVHVTGDHLVAHPDRPRTLIPARDYPGARAVKQGTLEWLRGGRELWCLTTTTRRIPVRGDNGIIMFADWEEIPAEDTAAQSAWFRSVWATLNRTTAPAIPSAVLAAEAGLSPDCLVACQGWTGGLTWRPIRDICVGDRVFDRRGHTTMVTGKVRIQGDQSTDAVAIRSPEHGPQVVSAATWIQVERGRWTPAALGGFAVVNEHPAWWEHLYTESGEFMLSGGWRLRDASDVGLGDIGRIVNAVVLKEGQLQESSSAE
jgi:hypothetical protein